MSTHPSHLLAVPADTQVLTQLGFLTTVRGVNVRWGWSRTMVSIVAPTMGLTLTPSPARAAELDWIAPAECASDAFLLKLADATEQPLEALPLRHIEIVVQRQGSSNWQLELSFDQTPDQPSPKRTLRGTSCEDVSRAAGVALAMALHDRVANEGAPADEPAPAPETRPEATPTPTPRVGPTTPKTAEASVVSEPPEPPMGRLPWRFPTHLGLVVDGALQGVPSFGFGAGVGVAVNRWELGLRGAYLPSVTLGNGDLGIRLHTYLGALVGCHLFSTAPVQPRVCLSYELGTVVGEGSGQGLAVQRTQRAFWHAVQPEIGIMAGLTESLSFSFAVGGAVALTEAAFVFDGGEVAHGLPRFSTRGLAAVVWIF